MARYVEAFLSVIRDIRSPNYTKQYEEGHWFDAWGAELHELCHEKELDNATFEIIKTNAERFIQNKYFSNDAEGYHLLMVSVMERLKAHNINEYERISSIINPTKSVPQPMKSEVQPMKSEVQLMKSEAQSKYAPVGNKDKVLDDKWNLFLIKLLKCVSRNERGEIIGIDIIARKNVIREALTEDLMFPEYIKQHNKQAGNVVVTLHKQDEMKSSAQDALDPRLQNVHVLQSLRHNLAGQLVGSGLYGGFGSTSDRAEAACFNFKTKLSLSKKSDINKENCEAYLEYIFNSSDETLAYSVNDAAFFSEKFLPTSAYVEQHAREFEPSIVEYYKNMARTKQPYEL